MFLIIKGEIELFKTTPFGEEKRISIFNESDFLGEGALMDDSPHSTTARTTKETTVLTLSRNKCSAEKRKSVLIKL